MRKFAVQSPHFSLRFPGVSRCRHDEGNYATIRRGKACTTNVAMTEHLECNYSVDGLDRHFELKCLESPLYESNAMAGLESNERRNS